MLVYLASHDQRSLPRLSSFSAKQEGGLYGGRKTVRLLSEYTARSGKLTKLGAHNAKPLLKAIQYLCGVWS